MVKGNFGQQRGWFSNTKGDSVSEKEKKQVNQTARYANFFQVGHNAYEFLLEFGQQDSDIHTRIYISPQHARMLSDLLLDALREHSLLLEKNEVRKKKEIQ